MGKLACISLITLGTLTSNAWGSEGAWQSVAKLEVVPGSSLVVLLHQHGVDLGLQVRSTLGTVIEQDGPDQAFGTEVVLLENSSAASARYELFVRTVLQGAGAEYDLETISNPIGAERAVARTLSEINRKWLRGEPTNSVLQLSRQALRSPRGRLSRTAVNTHLDILVRSGQSADVVDFVEELQSSPRGPPTAIADRVYRDYQQAGALWDSQQIDPAHRAMEAVAREIETSAEWSGVPARTRHWLEVSIKTKLGGIRIFAGRARGDRDLSDSGGQLIMATLRSIETDRDYSLRARLTEYLAGYYRLALDRSSNISAELYREAERLYERAGDRLSLASIRNNQAYAALGRGDVEAALQLYLETLELQKTSRHLEGQAHVRGRLGYLYYTIGDYRRGEVRLRESIDRYNEIRLSLKALHTQLQLAELLHADGRSDEALALLDEIRTNHGSQLSVEDSVRLLTQVATIRVDEGNLKAAEQALGELGPSDRFDTRNWESLQGTVWLYYLLDFEIVQARLELAKGSRPAAERRVERAIALLGASKREPLQQLQLLALQLSIFDQGSNEQRFVETADRALKLIESVRSSIDFHNQGPAWSSRTSDISNLVVSHYLERYETLQQPEDLERAFALLEGARARNLRDVRVGLTSERESDTEEESRREVQRANQALINALVLEQSSESFERRLAKAEEQYQLDNRAVRTTRAELPILDSDSIRQKLDAQTQVRVLFAGKSRSYILVLTRDSVNVIELPREGDLKTLIADSTREIKARGEDLSQSRRLAKLLFPPDNDVSSPARVLIESDGVLAAVPFSILLDLQAQGKVPPAVTVVPSLSEMFGTENSGELRQSPSRHRKELVIFSDPALALNTEAGTSVTWRAGLARLPYSQVEASSIAEYFRSDDVLNFTDKQATIGNITGEWARTARVLHVAAHGFGSTTDPFFVGLGLAKDSDDSGSGLLTTQHINAVHYKNELIVLSACDTGQGQLLDGEGYMSVARSFLASGAKATLSTLWPVPDRANAAFMKQFYYALTQLRHDPAASLVYAQQEMKRDSLFHRPYYWGAFVLHVVDGRYRPMQALTATN